MAIPIPKKFLFIGGVILAGAVLSAFLFFNYMAAPKDAYVLSFPDETVHTVLLTKEGFVPEELVIREGEKVIFENVDDNPYWPASSLHPNHEIYPEFDPKERIIPPENWEFVFDKPGVWMIVCNYVFVV